MFVYLSPNSTIYALPKTCQEQVFDHVLNIKSLKLVADLPAQNTVENLGLR